MVIFHKYYLLKKKFPDILTKYLSCFTCLFLALKICDCLISFDHLIKIFLKLLFKIQMINPVDINEKIIKETKERLFQIEFEILDFIGFDLNINMPYSYLQKMIPYFKDFLKMDKLILCATSFLNDSFKLPLCLYYDPFLILLACIYLCEFYFNVKLLDYNGIKWYHILDESVDFKIVKEIFLKLKMSYDNSSRNKHIFDIEFKHKELFNKPILNFNFENNNDNHFSNLNVEKNECKNIENLNVENNVINGYKNIENNVSLDLDKENKMNKNYSKPHKKLYSSNTENLDNKLTSKLGERKHSTINEENGVLEVINDFNLGLKEDANNNFGRIKEKNKKVQIVENVNSISIEINNENKFCYKKISRNLFNQKKEKDETNNSFYLHDSPIRKEVNIFQHIKKEQINDWPIEKIMLENNA